MPLTAFDKDIRLSSAQILIGVDEAGRGPLAGPVVAAACHIPPFLYGNAALAQINDSKKLTPAKRLNLFNELTKLPVIWATGYACAQEIDELNILQATFLAMRRALAKFKRCEAFVLVDGNHAVPNIKHPQKAVIGGDALSLSIAAASILAKVSRDNYMDIIGKDLPAYGFCGHKGYGTKQHIEAIKLHGPCKEHRKTFEPVSSMYYGLFGGADDNA